MKTYLGDKSIFNDERLGSKEKLVYCVLCAFRNLETNTCRSSLKEIGAAASLSIPSVTSAISTLISYEYISKTIRKDVDGGQLSNEYILNNFKEM